MAGTWKTVRIFISSTFRDMHAERDHLVKVVFPALRERLEPYRVYLDDIDLRWGVTREQAENNQVVGLCLQIIDECRPFFLGLLGERYGYVAAELPAETRASHGWLEHSAERSVTELEMLYGALAEPLMRGRALFCFRDPAALAGVPEPLRAEVYTESDPLRRAALAHLKDQIRTSGYPVVDPYPARWNPHAYDRSTRSRGRLDGLEAFGDAVRDRLWDAICDELGLPATPVEAPPDPLRDEREYHARFMEARTRVYAGREPTEQTLRSYAAGDETVVCLVTGPSGSGKSAALSHVVLARSRHDPATAPIAHFAGAGLRSTDVGSMLHRLCGELYDAVFAELVAGQLATIAGDDDEAWLRRQAIEAEYAIPADLEGRIAAFAAFLAKVPPSRRVVLVIDALDQLDGDDVSQPLGWLPVHLAPHVKVIVSCTGDTPRGVALLAAFEHRPHRTVALGALSDAERTEIISAVPSLSAKTLDAAQVALMLRNGATANPLFLRVAIEELRGFGSFERINERIRGLSGRDEANPVVRALTIFRPKAPAAARDPLTILFAQLLERLEGEFEPAIVRAALTGIAAARRGLFERELAELVAELPGADDILPVVRQLRPYLLSRGGLLGFFHRNLDDAVRSRYLPTADAVQAAHARLAAYFEAQPLANARRADELPWQLLHAGQADALGSLLQDIAFLESKANAGLVAELADDFSAFLAMRAGKHAAGERLGYRPAIVLLAEAVRRDLPFLVRHPGTLFQSLWNACGWFDDLAGLLESWRARRTGAAGDAPWLRSLRPPPIPLGASDQILFHGLPVRAVACIAERNGAGRRIATAGGRTVKIWEIGTRTAVLVRAFEVARGSTMPSVEEALDAAFLGHDFVVDAIASWRDIESIAWSPDGRRVAVGYGDEIAVHDVDSGECVMTLRHPDDTATSACVAFSPDGRSILGSHGTAFLRVWDSATGALQLERRSHDTVRRVAWTPTGVIIACGADRIEGEHLFVRMMVRLWERDGREVAAAEAAFLAYSANGSRYVVTNGTGVAVYGANPAEALTWDDLHVNPDRCALSDDGRLLASANGTTVDVSLLDNGQRVARHNGHGGTVSALAFLPPDIGAFVETLVRSPSQARAPASNADLRAAATQLVTGSENGSARVWFAQTEWLGDPSGASLERNPLEHTERVRGVAFSPDGTTFASVSWDALCVWDTPSGELLYTIPGIAAHAVAYAPDGLSIAVGRDGEIHRLAAGDGTALGAFTIEGDAERPFGPNGIAFASEGRRIAVAGYDGTVRVVDSGNGTELLRLIGHTDEAWCAVFSPGGGRIATGSADKTIRIWDATTGEQLACAEVAPPIDTGILGFDVRALAFASEDRLIAQCTLTKTMHLRDGTTGAFLGGVEGLGDVHALAGIAAKPWLALRRRFENETAVRAAETRTYVAWFPAAFDIIATHPGGRIFAGAAGIDVYLLALEGNPDPGSSPAEATSPA